MVWGDSLVLWGDWLVIWGDGLIFWGDRLVFWGDPDGVSVSPCPCSSSERSDCALGAGLRGEGGQHQREDLHHPGGGHPGAAVSG